MHIRIVTLLVKVNMNPFVPIIVFLVISSTHNFQVASVVRQVLLRPEVQRLWSVCNWCRLFVDGLFFLIVGFVWLFLFVIRLLLVDWLLLIDWFLLVDWLLIIHWLLYNLRFVKFLQFQWNDFYLFRFWCGHLHFNSRGDWLLIVFVSNILRFYRLVDRFRISS